MRRGDDVPSDAETMRCAGWNGISVRDIDTEEPASSSRELRTDSASDDSSFAFASFRVAKSDS